jgi:hypothetical protein
MHKICKVRGTVVMNNDNMIFFAFTSMYFEKGK